MKYNHESVARVASNYHQFRNAVEGLGRIMRGNPNMMSYHSATALFESAKIAKRELTRMQVPEELQKALDFPRLEQILAEAYRARAGLSSPQRVQMGP